MNQFLSGLVEMVGCILIIPVISHFGRRNSHIFCLAGAAVAMFLDEALRDSLKDDKGKFYLIIMSRFLKFGRRRLIVVAILFKTNESAGLNNVFKPVLGYSGLPGVKKMVNFGPKLSKFWLKYLKADLRLHK